MDNHLRSAIRQIALTEGDCLSYEDWKILSKACETVLEKRGCNIRVSNSDTYDEPEEFIVMVRDGLTLEKILFEVTGETDFSNREIFYSCRVSGPGKDGAEVSYKWKENLDKNTLAEIGANYYISIMPKPQDATANRPEFSIYYETEAVRLLSGPNLTLQVALERTRQYLGLYQTNVYVYRNGTLVSLDTIPEAGDEFYIFLQPHYPTTLEQ